MASAIPQERLAEIVRERACAYRRAGGRGRAPRRRTRRAGRGRAGRASRRRSGSRRSRSGSPRRSPRSCSTSTSRLDGGTTAGMLLSHTADLRQNSRELLPERVPRALVVLERGRSCSRAGRARPPRECPTREAVRERLLEPLGSRAHELRGAGGRGLRPCSGRRDGTPAGPEVVYPESRRAAGGLWSTVGDLLRFAAHQIGGPARCPARS